MNTSKEANTEQIILKCAEEVFLERGFDGAKTTEIARRAGVNHAMLHYYFRTKLNLFNVIFEKKLVLLSASFSEAMSREDLPFFDRIKAGIEIHFDFIRENPRLLFFLYTGMINDDDRKMLFVKNILPNAKVALDSMNAAIEEEVSKGTIREITVIELLLNIVSLNMTTFLAAPILEVIAGNKETAEQFVEERKKNNVEFILNSIRIDSNKPNYRQTSLAFDF